MSPIPNHITTILRGSREVVHALLTEEGVDFNRIIPMPDDVIRGGIGHAKDENGEMQKVYWPEGERADDDPMGMKVKPIPYPEGATDWYEWSIEHWGTKWNGYEHDVTENDTVLRFDTAWAHPYPVIIRLSEMYPTEMLMVVYADEDLGSNFGAYAILDGQIKELPCPDEGTAEARDLASLIKYGTHYEDVFAEDGEEKQHFPAIDVLRHSLHAGEL